MNTLKLARRSRRLAVEAYRAGDPVLASWHMRRADALIARYRRQLDRRTGPAADTGISA